MTVSTRRRRLLAALVAVQVLVPLWATTQGVPRKFGFHMFTGAEVFEVTVRDDDGDEVEVDLTRWIVMAREDVDWSRRLPEAICRDTPEAAEVVVRQWKQDKRFACDR